MNITLQLNWTTGANQPTGVFYIYLNGKKLTPCLTTEVARELKGMFPLDLEVIVVNMLIAELKRDIIFVTHSADARSVAKQIVEAVKQFPNKEQHI
jgi:hypothetical protein